MSSEESDLSEELSEVSFVSESEHSDSMEIIEGGAEAHQNEPFAGSEDEQLEETYEDPDGLAPAILAARSEGGLPVSNWCKCGRCNSELLEGAPEYRCCREVGEAVGKLVFDGSIERVGCITEHPDYSAITNEAVLRLAGPFLKDARGGHYRCPRNSDSTSNWKKFYRAVSYRWIVRWMCGYMGWDNTRPLSACVYHNIRTRYLDPTSNKGYLPPCKRR